MVKAAGRGLDANFADIPDPPSTIASSARVSTGRLIPPSRILELYSSGEWEEFVQEWVACLRRRYKEVKRFSGPGDKGIDVAGFRSTKRLRGKWDNYQCKHYDDALPLPVVLGEIGKILFYAFKREFRLPEEYWFVAPLGVATSVQRLLCDAPALREKVVEVWPKVCERKIIVGQSIPLSGALRSFIEGTDFERFGYKTSLDLVEVHKQYSPFHTVRFGGGLPARPQITTPPVEIGCEEVRYVAQLIAAYADYRKCEIRAASELGHLDRVLAAHFKRSREAFYSAECLRNFARDAVPPGTFEALQTEVFSGVVDSHDDDHADGYARVRAVTRAAQELQLIANALASEVKVPDRHGICHQLANEDRLTWVKKK
jgi:hypothetical protein